jgi:four helix bundle protein
MGKIKHFRQLEVWQEAHKLVLMVYQVTHKFPSDERFGLVPQMRRAAVSIAANVAEGFKRLGIQDKIRFYNFSEGSLEELKYYFLLSKDLAYISSDAHDGLMAQAESVGRLLHGLIASTENRKGHLSVAEPAEPFTLGYLDSPTP